MADYISKIQLPGETSASPIRLKEGNNEVRADSDGIKLIGNTESIGTIKVTSSSGSSYYSQLSSDSLTIKGGTGSEEVAGLSINELKFKVCDNVQTTDYKIVPNLAASEYGVTYTLTMPKKDGTIATTDDIPTNYVKKDNESGIEIMHGDLEVGQHTTGTLYLGDGGKYISSQGLDINNVTLNGTNGLNIDINSEVITKVTPTEISIGGGSNYYAKLQSGSLNLHYDEDSLQLTPSQLSMSVLNTSTHHFNTVSLTPSSLTLRDGGLENEILIINRGRTINWSSDYLQKSGTIIIPSTSGTLVTGSIVSPTYGTITPGELVFVRSLSPSTPSTDDYGKTQIKVSSSGEISIWQVKEVEHPCTHVQIPGWVQLL